jgi:hypothetical protein
MKLRFSPWTPRHSRSTYWLCRRVGQMRGTAHSPPPFVVTIPNDYSSADCADWVEKSSLADFAGWPPIARGSSFQAPAYRSVAAERKRPEARQAKTAWMAVFRVSQPKDGHSGANQTALAPTHGRPDGGRPACEAHLGCDSACRKPEGAMDGPSGANQTLLPDPRPPGRRPPGMRGTPRL